VPVRADDASQRVDIDALVRALGERTAALIINTPSNPTGHVIEHDEMTAIVDVLEHHNRRTGRRILLIVDEAYGNLMYEPARRVAPFAYYKTCVLARSFSKDMGPGWRADRLPGRASPRWPVSRPIAGWRAACARWGW